MALQNTTLAPEDFHKRLNDSTLAPPQKLTGIVKKSDKGKSFMFALAGCDSWVEIPLDAIAQVMVMGETKCKDHSHPLIEVEFKADPGQAGWALSLLASGLRTMAFISDDVWWKKEEATQSCSRCTQACKRRCGNDFFCFTNCVGHCPC